MELKTMKNQSKMGVQKNILKIVKNIDLGPQFGLQNLTRIETKNNSWQQKCRCKDMRKSMQKKRFWVYLKHLLRRDLN